VAPLKPYSKRAGMSKFNWQAVGKTVAGLSDSAARCARRAWRAALCVLARPVGTQRACQGQQPARAHLRAPPARAERRPAGRQALLRRGVDEEQLDAEARELLGEAAGQQGADEGVSMLLAAQEELVQARRVPV